MSGLVERFGLMLSDRMESMAALVSERKDATPRVRTTRGLSTAPPSGLSELPRTHLIHCHHDLESRFAHWTLDRLYYGQQSTRRSAAAGLSGGLLRFLLGESFRLSHDAHRLPGKTPNERQ